MRSPGGVSGPVDGFRANTMLRCANEKLKNPRLPAGPAPISTERGLQEQTGAFAGWSGINYAEVGTWVSVAVGSGVLVISGVGVAELAVVAIVPVAVALPGTTIWT
jgi:hypothetical protein